jgi:hypothetical protein
MKLPHIKVQDCFEIPLSDGRYAYGRYLYRDDRYGPLCEIFSTVSNTPIPLSQLDTSKRLFPPVYIGFGSFFKDRKWRVIGSVPITDFQFPHFRRSHATKPGKYDDWIVYDGEKKVMIGSLKPGMEHLEVLCGWSPQALMKRIETGKSLHDSIL